MGLYAADTLGDGNCLALADQLYGDARHHARLRAETCGQLAAHPERYAAFVETEKPFDQYVAAMRTSGTYGGHLELAAFAHRFQKPIRIVQPDLVYHNWEHYSSLRSLDGPHTGLPRLALPADADEHAQKEHEDEVLVLRSVPGTSRAKARRMLYEWEDWETVVEKLIEEGDDGGDDDEDDDDDEEQDPAPPPPRAAAHAARRRTAPSPPAQRELAI
ncbi:hypothetical protein CBS14141_002342 [Malassezia furfur]|nr:hypothetical protein CBS14141_002342 [Malassezia furfur]